jgi:hypothetical protein
MTSVVAVDAASKGSGQNRCLIGIVLEVGDVSNFRSHYIQSINKWYRDCGINRENAVIKSDHLSRSIPSYEISEARDDLQRRLLDTEWINRIHVTICWHEDSVHTPLGHQQGGEFVNRFVKAYFPVVALWQYHRSERRYSPVTTAKVDSFSGKITKAWKYVGNEFDLDIVPKGDLTYPEISTADILCSALEGILPDDEPYREYKRISEGWLLNRLPDTETQFVQTKLLSHDSRNSAIDHIKPHKYDVKPHLQYPHPVIFLDEKVLSGKEREAIDRSQLLGYLCNEARSRGGCVTKLDVENFPFVVQNGDYIVYNPVDSSRSETHRNLHPNRDITLVDATELSREFESGIV